MKRNTYNVLTEKYDLISKPYEVTFTKFDYEARKAIPFATVTFVNGAPKDYEFLGHVHDGIKVPKANDWMEWKGPSMYSDRHYLSPSLKVWYSVDSSG